MITRALAACAAALALVAAFFLVVRPGAAERPPAGITASVATDTDTADTRAADTHAARADRTGVASPHIAATDDSRAETAGPKNLVRPAPYLVQTKVAEKRGKSYLVLHVSSRTGADATLVIKQWICRGPKAPGTLTNAASPTGVTSPTGAASPTGVTSPTGAASPTGASSPIGASSPTGTTKPARPTEPTGPSGSAGSVGSPGSVESAGSSEATRCSLPSTTVRVNARWTVSTRRYLGNGRFRRVGAPTWSIKQPPRT